MQLQYEDLCAKWAGYCYDNQILQLSGLIPEIEAGNISMTYPLFFDPNNFEVRKTALFSPQKTYA